MIYFILFYFKLFLFINESRIWYSDDTAINLCKEVELKADIKLTGILFLLRFVSRCMIFSWISRSPRLTVFKIRYNSKCLLWIDIHERISLPELTLFDYFILEWPWSVTIDVRWLNRLCFISSSPWLSPERKPETLISAGNGPTRGPPTSYGHELVQGV